MNHRIYIAKFLEHYDPFVALGLESDPPIDDVIPLAEYQRDLHTARRDRDYNLRRIKFFVNELRAGRELDPIEIDNQGDHVEGLAPELIDGHHRLIAAILERHKTIRCTYGGRLDFLDDMMRPTPPSRDEPR